MSSRYSSSNDNVERLRAGPMQIIHKTGPPVDTHAYLVLDEASSDAWIVDAPLQTFAALSRTAEERGCSISRLILTHGHFDHLLDAAEVVRAGVPIAMHPADEILLRAPQTALFGVPHPMPEVPVSETLADGQELTLGAGIWQVRHTPGHSPGHISLYCASEGILIGGDLIFQGGYGRIDLPGSDGETMRRSLQRTISLPASTLVYPGHGPQFTLADEAGWLRPLLAEDRAWR